MGPGVCGYSVEALPQGRGAVDAEGGLDESMELLCELGLSERILVVAWREGDLLLDDRAVVEGDAHAVWDAGGVARGEHGVFDDRRAPHQVEQRRVVQAILRELRGRHGAV